MKMIVEIERGKEASKNSKWLKETDIEKWVKSGSGITKRNVKGDLFDVNMPVDGSGRVVEE